MQAYGILWKWEKDLKRKTIHYVVGKIFKIYNKQNMNKCIKAGSIKILKNWKAEKPAEVTFILGLEK